MKSSRVGILGGGFAGLAAAAELEKNGIDYVLLEASGRLGGRVYPIKDSMKRPFNHKDKKFQVMEKPYNWEQNT